MAARANPDPANVLLTTKQVTSENLLSKAFSSTLAASKSTAKGKPSKPGLPSARLLHALVSNAAKETKRSRIDNIKSMAVSYTGHERIDQRSLALHRAIAEKLRGNPQLLEIARDNLDRWEPAAGRSQPYITAWRAILARPLPEILNELTDDTERMRAMRQATPFAGVLSPKERWAIYALFAPAAGAP